MNVLSLQDLALPDLNLPFAPPSASASPSPSPSPEPGPAPTGQAAESGLGDLFSHPDPATAPPWVMHIEQQSALVDGLRSLFHGPAGLVRLRLWMFMTLVEQPGMVLHRDEVDELWQALRPDAAGLADTVLQRFRDTGLLAWDDSRHRCTLTPLARQLARVLSPLAGTSDPPPAR